MELDYLRLPWHAEGCHIYDADGSHVGLTEPAKVSCGGMAQYIAGACSAFPELLKAMEALTDHFAAVMGGPVIQATGVRFENGIEGIPTITAARRAIARARGS